MSKQVQVLASDTKMSIEKIVLGPYGANIIQDNKGCSISYIKLDNLTTVVVISAAGLKVFFV